MNKFIKRAWTNGFMVYIFVIFMFISLSMVSSTHGPEYAIIVFIFSFIILMPTLLSKLIQRKTRIKKVVLGVILSQYCRLL